MTSENVAPPLSKDNIPRQDLVSLVRKWADVNTDGLLDASCKTFSTVGVEGLIGYRIEAGNAVVFGDPVCAAEDKGKLATEFQNYCQSQKMGVVYAVVSEEFAGWAAQNLASVSIEFGEKFILDPLSNPMDKKGSKAGLVRKKVKHALAEGAVIQEYTGDDPKLESEIEAVANAWLDSRHGPQVYLAHVSLFQDRYGKRWFYAMMGDHLVGILLLNQLQVKEGWLLNNVMITKDAPNGISELLVISALQTLEKEGCRFVTIGPVPAKQLGQIVGLGNLSTKATRFAYKCAQKIFHLNGHEIFWEKFQPEIQSSFLLFPQQNLSFSSIRALLRAFNVGI